VIGFGLAIPIDLLNACDILINLVMASTIASIILSSDFTPWLDREKGLQLIIAIGKKPREASNLESRPKGAGKIGS
jgi:hypothetical protein